MFSVKRREQGTSSSLPGQCSAVQCSAVGEARERNIGGGVEEEELDGRRRQGGL